MRKYAIAFVLVVVMAVVYYYSLSSKKPLYGNDERQIKAAIQAVKGYEDQTITILAVRDFDDLRIVGLLADDRPAHAEFRKNESGDYEWRQIEAVNGSSLGFFLLKQEADQKIMIVTDSNNAIAKLSVKINGSLVEHSIRPSQSSVTWIDLPPSQNGEYRFDDYQYFDEDNRLIES